MADVLPFQGLRYNPSLVSDLARVICPPYDIISPAFHEQLHTRDPHNFIHIEDARTHPGDTENDNKYTRAAATLQNWLQERVLQPEAAPAFYLDDHYFTFNGKRFVRRGIFARVRLVEWEAGIVKPHENVIAVHVSDRINVLRQVQVNTSPVLAMYRDKPRRLAAWLKARDTMTPVMDITLPEGDRHVLRAVNGVNAVTKITEYFRGQPLYIADGHHRYTSALAYRRERMAAKDASPEDACNFVMMTLVDFDDPGLVILAPHRALRNLPASALVNLAEKLQAYFDVQRLPLDSPGVWDDVDRLQSDAEYVRLACLINGSPDILLLTLRHPEKLGETIPYFKEAVYRKLDVSMVDKLILEQALGLGSGFSDETKISYVVDRPETIEKVRRGEYQVAFFVKPVNPELIREVSDAGAKMPRKSTYFYPKAPAGLVVNPLFSPQDAKPSHK